MHEPLDSSELPDQAEERVSMATALRYATLIWITSVLLSPALMMLVMTIMEGGSSLSEFFNKFAFALRKSGQAIGVVPKRVLLNYSEFSTIFHRFS